MTEGGCGNDMPGYGNDGGRAAGMTEEGRGNDVRGRLPCIPPYSPRVRVSLTLKKSLW